MTYEHREGGIVIIYKKKKDLTSYERLLVKTEPEKYIRRDPGKKDKKKKDKKERRARRLEKENEKFWKEVDEMDKNPKKYKKKKKRQDELLKRYMKQSKKDKKKQMSKKERLRQKSLVAYFDHRVVEVNMDRLGMNKTNNTWFDPSRQFAQGFFQPKGQIDLADVKKMSLLRQLEDEITASVHGDLYESHLVQRHYGGGMKQFKKDKKRHKKEGKKGKRKKHKVKEVFATPEYMSQILNLK